jgi:hypothetical protein
MKVIDVLKACMEVHGGNRHRFAARRVGIGFAVIAGVGLAVSGCTSSGGSGTSHPSRSAPVSASVLAPLHGTYSPAIDPTNFVQIIDNRFWPLTPGTGYRYKGVRGSTPQLDDEVVLHRTKQILGVPCTVVRDTVSEGGRTVERTFDWYAQDRQGNVWYMGEDSLELKNGHMVKASDSWESGINGAKPGIVMPGSPQPGDAYRQEYYPPGKALDQARVLRLDGSLTVPYGTFTHVLVTSERSPLEPQTEQKYYAHGLGEVAERVVRGHHEEFQLVRVTH